MLKAALFIVAKKQKQFEYPSTDEWIKKIWCIHTMEYLAIKRNEVLIHATTWMNLKSLR